MRFLRGTAGWRPEEYGKPGTKVTLDARLNGVDTGADGGCLSGEEDWAAKSAPE